MYISTRNWGVDTRANFSILQNTSTTNQDGMLINYGSTGGSNSNIKLYANGTTERMRIRGNTGNVGINETAPSEKLEVGEISQLVIIAIFYQVIIVQVIINSLGRNMERIQY